MTTNKQIEWCRNAQRVLADLDVEEPVLREIVLALQSGQARGTVPLFNLLVNKKAEIRARVRADGEALKQRRKKAAIFHSEGTVECGHGTEFRVCAAATQYACLCCDSCSELCAAKFAKFEGA